LQGVDKFLVGIRLHTASVLCFQRTLDFPGNLPNQHHPRPSPMAHSFSTVESERAPRGTSCKHPLILCVDDDPDITRGIAKTLSNFEVRTIFDVYGQQGISDALRAEPDLIITDLRMPRVGGEDLLTQVKQNPRTRQIPVIVLTGQRDMQLQNRLRNLGADGFLNKPVHYTALLAEISRFVALREKNWESA
jgi:CheY-like chemotaxis protein